MSEVWLDPGTHAVRFFDGASACHDAIAEFFTAGAASADPLVLVARRATFDGAAALLASGRFGPPVPADRILFADAEATLATIMDGDTVDPARADAFFRQILAKARGGRAGGTIRFYGEMVDVLCERDNFAAAVALEVLFADVFVVEPRLAVLCGYARARFANRGAAHLAAVCGTHTHVAPIGDPPPQDGERPPQDTGGEPPAPFVYVIDDDPSIRRSLGRLLKLALWQVRTFDSGEAFVAELDGLSPGCLVVDIQLGGMSGLDLLAHMQTARPTWPAIAMSGSHDEGAEREALQLGARVFLHKPLDAQPLLDAIALAFA
ncbi:MAG TPA: response regulator [Rhizomicrobium sp.]|nr:response regulator [Rhizomicrobium sp.]